MKKILIYGGTGGLGSVLVAFFKGKGFEVTSIARHKNLEADKNIVVHSQTLAGQGEFISQSIPSTEKYEAIINVAGGWCGGNAASTDFLQNVSLSIQQSLWTSSISAHLATKHLKTDGLLVVTGAAPVIEGATPGMIAYGAAKASVHHLLKSLSAKGGGLAEQVTALCIAPITLDTPSNRKFMPDADFSTWTPLNWMAETLFDWTESKLNRPPTGSLLTIVTKDYSTAFQIN